MATNLQTLINSAQKLSVAEQVELIKAVSQFLAQNYTALSHSDFWQPHTIEEIVETQQTQPIEDVAMLQADFWPEEETADDFIDYIYQQRQEDRLHS